MALTSQAAECQTRTNAISKPRPSQVRRLRIRVLDCIRSFGSRDVHRLRNSGLRSWETFIYGNEPSPNMSNR